MDWWLLFAVLYGVFLALLVARNTWVGRVRRGVLMDHRTTLEESLREYERLPSYGAMMLRVWVWDVEKFKK